MTEDSDLLKKLRGLVAELDAMVDDHCGENVHSRFCEDYGCSSIWEISDKIKGFIR